MGSGRGGRHAQCNDTSAVAGKDETDFISVAEADYIKTGISFPSSKIRHMLSEFVCLILYCIIVEH